MPPDPPLLAPALATLPPFTAAWAYGSSIFAQPHLTPPSRGGPRLSQPAQLDVIIAVADTTAWHAANLASNPAHYTPLARWVGGGGVTALAAGVGVGVWFNQGCALPRGAASTPLAPGLPPPSALKYGVVQVGDLVADLLEWRHLYLAGRLHKPTVEVRGTEAAPADAAPPTLPLALTANTAAATAAALLLLPPTFDDTQWRDTVAGLSYGGDVRHAINADGHAKPARIAAGSAAGLDAMYLGHLMGGVGQAGGVHRLVTGWVQDPRPRARAARCWPRSRPACGGGWRWRRGCRLTPRPPISRQCWLRVCHAVHSRAARSRARCPPPSRASCASRPRGKRCWACCRRAPWGRRGMWWPS